MGDIFPDSSRIRNILVLDSRNIMRESEIKTLNQVWWRILINQMNVTNPNTINAEDPEVSPSVKA